MNSGFNVAEYFDDSLETNRDVYVKAVGIKGELVEYICGRRGLFLDDQEIFLAALKCQGGPSIDVLEHASKNLMKNEDFLFKIVPLCDTVLKHVRQGETSSFYKNLVLEAVKKHGMKEFLEADLRQQKDADVLGILFLCHDSLVIPDRNEFLDLEFRLAMKDLNLFLYLPPLNIWIMRFRLAL